METQNRPRNGRPNTRISAVLSGEMYAVRGESMKGPSKLIAVVDDDESVREALPDLLREFGFGATAFETAETFLSSDAPELVSCLILDIAMPGMTGPELLKELINRGLRIPVIFITAHADANLRTGLLQKGAVECLFKPFGDQDLRAALARALASGPTT